MVRKYSVRRTRPVHAVHLWLKAERLVLVLTSLTPSPFLLRQKPQPRGWCHLLSEQTFCLLNHPGYTFKVTSGSAFPGWFKIQLTIEMKHHISWGKQKWERTALKWPAKRAHSPAWHFKTLIALGSTSCDSMDWIKLNQLEFSTWWE